MGGPIKEQEYDCDYVPDAEEDINYDTNNLCTNDDVHQLEDIRYNKSPTSFSSVIKFQVGLSDIVNKHKG